MRPCSAATGELPRSVFCHRVQKVLMADFLMILPDVEYLEGESARYRQDSPPVSRRCGIRISPRFMCCPRLSEKRVTRYRAPVPKGQWPDENPCCECKESRAGRHRRTTRGRIVNGIHGAGDGQPAASRARLTGRTEQPPLPRIPASLRRKRGRPVAGDGGCASDRASRTVTRDLPLANSISLIRTGIYPWVARCDANHVIAHTMLPPSAERYLAVGESAACPALLAGQRGVRHECLRQPFRQPRRGLLAILGTHRAR